MGNPGWVYFLLGIIKHDGTTIFKVGETTKSAKIRLKQTDGTGTAFETRVYDKVWCYDRLAVESAIKKTLRFYERQTRDDALREWFYLTMAEADQILEHLKSKSLPVAQPPNAANKPVKPKRKRKPKPPPKRALVEALHTLGRRALILVYITSAIGIYVILRIDMIEAIIREYYFWMGILQ